LITTDGKVLARSEIQLKQPLTVDAVIDSLIQSAKDAIQNGGKTLDDVRAIGIGSPGLLDYEKGILKQAANFPGFHNVPLVERVSKALGKPAVLDCDASAAAAAEVWTGVGQDPSIKSLVVFTLGTGIGGGIVIDRKIIHGIGMAGEIGHMCVEPDLSKARPCGCGGKGCLERYCSASAVAVRAKEGLFLQKTSLSDVKEVTCEAVFEEAKKGDAYATKIVDETARYLGLACTYICRVVDPQVIVFTGGMAKAGQDFYDRVKFYYNKYNWTIAHPKIDIVPSKVGNNPGIIGAGYAAKLLDQRLSTIRGKL